MSATRHDGVAALQQSGIILAVPDAARDLTPTMLLLILRNAAVVLVAVLVVGLLASTEADRDVGPTVAASTPTLR
jgi:hypothetical protein